MSKRFVLALVTAAASALTAGTTHASAPVAQVPATELAARSSELVDRVVRALVAHEGESHISRLWVFPTGEANTAIVHYRWTTDVNAHEPGPTVERLALITLDGDEVARFCDLTTAPLSISAVADAGTR
jgi:hypothetical protein